MHQIRVKISTKGESDGLMLGDQGGLPDLTLNSCREQWGEPQSSQSKTGRPRTHRYGDLARQ
eukprot:3666075-Pyramimonas_sp.AAC.1